MRSRESQMRLTKLAVAGLAALALGFAAPAVAQEHGPAAGGEEHAAGGHHLLEAHAHVDHFVAMSRETPRRKPKCYLRSLLLFRAHAKEKPTYERFSAEEDRRCSRIAVG